MYDVLLGEEESVSFFAVQADDGRCDLDFGSFTELEDRPMEDVFDFLLEDQEELPEAP